MTCKLCQQEKPLIKKSHILPDFLFKKLYDPHNKLRRFDAVQMAKGNPRVSRPSSGAYEGELLCQDCDNRILGQYETYISRIIARKLAPKDKINFKITYNNYGLKFIEVSNIDYTKTKLFLLSILYRAHLSKNQEFKDIDLGPYAEKLRDIIYNNKFSDDLSFQISVMRFSKDSEFSSFIGQPIRRKIDNTTMYTIVINGFLIMLFLKENGISKKTSNLRLQKNNSITILEIPPHLAKKFLLSYMGIK